MRDERGERAVEPRGLTADREGARDEPGEQAQHRDHAEESEFLADDREQEVGVRFREVEEFLDARAEPDADPFAAAEGDQRMRQLVAGLQRIGPRIQEARDALQAIRRDQDQRDEADDEQHHQAREQPPVHPAEEQQAHRDDGDDRERAEVGFPQQQRAGEQHHGGHRQEALAEAAHERRLAHRVVGGVEDDGELREFGRLEVQPHEPQPAAAAVHLRAEAGHEDDDEQQCRDGEEPRRDLLPAMHRHLEHGEAGGEPDPEEDRMADEVVRRLELREPARLRRRDRRRVHHHESDREQQDRRPDERFVELGHEARGALHRVGEHDWRSFRWATAARNTSARCS